MSFTSPLQLRQIIESALGDLVGNYTFTNGQEVKAIALIKGGESFPPTGTKVSGLEVVVFYPEPTIEGVLGGYMVANEWIIHLKQWNPKDNTLTATQELLKVLENVKRTLKSPANEQLGIPEMMQIKLLDFYAINN